MQYTVQSTGCVDVGRHRDNTLQRNVFIVGCLYEWACGGGHGASFCEELAGLSGIIQVRQGSTGLFFATIRH